MLKFIAVALVAVSFVGATPVRNQDDNHDLLEYIQAVLKQFPKIACKNVSEEVPPIFRPEEVKLYIYRGDKEAEGNMESFQKIFEAPFYNAAQETKILIHGWLLMHPIDLFRNLTRLYTFRGKNVNVISVDWSKYACSQNFEFTAQNQVQKIGGYVRQMIHYMRTLSDKSIHEIGFDMGAHIAGIGSKTLGNEKVERITALSPAGRFFEHMPADQKLQKGDAKFVDSINTNQGGAGYGNKLGDVDFFPNGGRVQPLAENATGQATKDVLSHFAAPLYYTESVELGHRGFIGKKCGSYQDFQNNKCALNQAEIMGESNTLKVTGSVYLNVNAKPYYSKGIYGLYPYEL